MMPMEQNRPSNPDCDEPIRFTARGEAFRCIALPVPDYDYPDGHMHFRIREPAWDIQPEHVELFEPVNESGFRYGFLWGFFIAALMMITLLQIGRMIHNV